MKKTYYEVLGLKKDAQPVQIRKAYHRLAMKWHPDKNNDQRPMALEQFIQINEAYSILSKQQLRFRYDCKIEQQDSYTMLFNYFCNKMDEDEEESFEFQECNEFLTQEEQELINNFKRRVGDPLKVKKKIRKQV